MAFLLQLFAGYPWLWVLVLGLPVGCLLAFWLFRSRSGLAGWSSRVFSRAGFFWASTLIFMGVSVAHAGIFFGITGNGHDLPGVGPLMGFAVSFFLDLVTVILMQALLEARYRGDDIRSNQLLFFIVVCCGTSTFANLAISLNDFSASKMLPNAPAWVQGAAPYVLASFPLFVIMMAVAAELILNVRPLDKLKEEDYEADEKKRVRILEIRNEYYEKQVNAEIALRRIRASSRASKGGLSWSWLPWVKSVDAAALVASATNQISTDLAALAKQHTDLAGRVGALPAPAPVDAAGLAADVVARLDAVYGPVLAALTEQVQSLQSGVESGQEENGASGDFVQDMRALLVDYPGLVQWIESGQKSVSEHEIIKVTGHSARMVRNRINDKKFKGTRRSGAYLVSSVVDWLKSAPLPGNRDTGASLLAIPASSNGHGSNTLAASVLASARSEE